jgi:putative nucleotidyltransferase with HDIG domain
MKRKILFVDDEIKILEGLGRMLRSMRSEWDMSFATSGPAALRLMAEKSYDVIVSDMRMPEMDGAELLTIVKDTYPDSVRIILSGHAEREMIMRTVRPAHQYISKPCEAETIKGIISRACALRDILNQEGLKATVSRLESLPCLPSLYNEVMEELQRSDCSIDRVGHIIAEDLAMTAKILQLVNSAFFGMRRRFPDVKKAVVFLGLDTVKSLVLTFGLFEQFDAAKMEVLDMGSLMTHSMHTSALAKRIAALEGLERESTDDTFMSALLHDVGKLVIADNMPETYREILELSQKEQISLHDAERAVLNATHAEVGAYLLGLWGLPDAIVEAIAFHHQPADHPTTCFEPLVAVHVADALDNWSSVPKETEGPPGGLDSDFLSALGLDQRLPVWMEALREQQEATN